MPNKYFSMIFYNLQIVTGVFATFAILPNTCKNMKT